MESSLQAQLALLRKRIEKIETRYPAPAPPEAIDCLGGVVVQTEHGEHLEIERHYPLDYLHGKVEVSRLGEIANRNWVYLDTETTGLAGGSGTLAFLIGAARMSEDGFRLKQWFIREHGEEASALASLAEYLAGFDTLVTYNGKSFDQPLLETRFTMARQRSPFTRMEHLDLLYGARRIWKLRYESCRLVELERQILGHERVGDVPGAMIPQIYFEFLRTGRANHLRPVIEHNALDILSLAFLASIIPAVFENPTAAVLSHGAELGGLARWLASESRWEEAAILYRKAVDAEIQDELMFRCLWELARIEKRRGNLGAALAIWEDLARSRNAYQAEAWIELAKYYEHKAKDARMALDCAMEAGRFIKTAELMQRQLRLRNRLAKGTLHFD